MDTAYGVESKVKVRRRFSTKQMVLIGMLAALSYILMLIKLPFTYLGFLELEFSDIPAVVAGLMYGPLTAVVIEIIKDIIKGITTSHTVGVGELANAIVSIAYMLPACYLYKKLSGKKKIVIAFSVATISMAVAGAVTNYFLLLPMYSKVIAGGMDTIVAMGSGTIPLIKDAASFVIIGITPFNILKGILISVIGFLVYDNVGKRLH